MEFGAFPAPPADGEDVDRLEQAVEKLEEAARAPDDGPYRASARPPLETCAHRGVHLSVDEARGYLAALRKLEFERDEALDRRDDYAARIERLRAGGERLDLIYRVVGAVLAGCAIGFAAYQLLLFCLR